MKRTTNVLLRQVPESLRARARALAGQRRTTVYRVYLSWLTRGAEGQAARDDFDQPLAILIRDLGLDAAMFVHEANTMLAYVKAFQDTGVWSEEAKALRARRERLRALEHEEAIAEQEAKFPGWKAWRPSPAPASTAPSPMAGA